MRCVLVCLLFSLLCVVAASNVTVGDVCGPTAGPCEHHGQCVHGACVCPAKWAGALCGTRRFSKFVAFVLQVAVGPPLGLPPGAGMFYIGRLDLALPQLIAGIPPFAFAWAVFLLFALRRLRACLSSGRLLNIDILALNDDEAANDRKNYAPLLTPAETSVDLRAGDRNHCLKCASSCCGACALLVLAAGALALWAYCTITTVMGTMRDAHGHTLVDDM